LESLPLFSAENNEKYDRKSYGANERASDRGSRNRQRFSMRLASSLSMQNSGADPATNEESDHRSPKRG
jgi:hypothetical protein